MIGRSAVVGGLIAILATLNLYQYFQSDTGAGTGTGGSGSESEAAARSELSNEEIGENFHRVFVESKQLFKNKWFGAPTLQHPFDVWITQEIIYEVRPDLIVETGTHYGGSAMLWATILEQVNPDGQVITVDIMDKRSAETRRHPISKERIEFLKGSSTGPGIVSKITERARGKKVMVILDSLHTKDHVLAELRAYAPLVGRGSYLIVQDTHLGETIPFWYQPLEKRWQPGPLAAIKEFMASDDRFVVDSSRERLLVTNNRGGFLKRVADAKHRR